MIYLMIAYTLIALVLLGYCASLYSRAHDVVQSIREFEETSRDKP